MLSTEGKQRIVAEHQRHAKGSGGSEVQVALITERIRGLTSHLRKHHKDHATRRGLLMLVGKRRRLLRYLSKENAGRYRDLIAKLGLRR